MYRIDMCKYILLFLSLSKYRNAERSDETPTLTVILDMDFVDIT